jgi:heme/copper-type cytochrome/quinol oxidase subunit 2
VTYINIWQYWLWFTFTFLINAYFVFIFRALTYRRADMRGRRAVGDKRRSAWPEMFTCAFPLLWCINVLNNSLGILKAVEANGGYALLTVQLSGFQWGWRYGYGELGYARMLLTPVRVGLDSVLRPGRGQGGSLRDACLAEAHFCRAWLATAGLLEVGGAGGIRLGLFQHGLGVTAQGGQNTLSVRRACLDGSYELVMDPVRLLRATGTFALPTHSTVRLLATAEDVTHSWALPSLGLKLDCVPGRLYVSFLHLNREGVYYGQCSELCGWNHYNMPIVLYALAYEHFVMWWELELHAQFAHVVAAHRGNYTLLSLKYK